MDAKTRFLPAKSRKHRIAERAREAAAGQPAWIDAEVVRAHITTLTDIGMTPAMIGRAAGVAPLMVRQIIAKKTTGTRSRYAVAILGVTHAPHPAQAHCLAVGARRRVQALGALGWPAKDIANHLGSTASNLRNALARDVITYAKWAAIRDLYDRLSATPGPSKEAAVYCRHRGFQLPLDWETVDIDDPRQKPRMARDTRALDTVDVITRRNEVARLSKAGLPAWQIAERLGVNERTVQRDRTARKAA